MIAFTSVTLITTTAVTLIVFAFDIVLKEGILWLLQGAGGDAMTDAVDIIEETEVVEEEEPTTSPYDLEGGWYVIHSYGLREQGQGKPRDPHPVDAHGGSDLSRW